MRKIIEASALIAGLVLAVKWAMNPSGPYEPFIALLGATWATFDFFFTHNKSQKEIHPTSIAAQLLKAKETAKSESLEPAMPLYTWASTSVFFLERFSAAFPGLRETAWFNGQEAIERLGLLLKSPLTYKIGDSGETNPIWWFGRGNLQIINFKQIEPGTILINCEEYNISHIVASYSTSSSFYKYIYK